VGFLDLLLTVSGVILLLPRRFEMRFPLSLFGGKAVPTGLTVILAPIRGVLAFSEVLKRKFLVTAVADFGVRF
jgi:hypothetical protein